MHSTIQVDLDSLWTYQDCLDIEIPKLSIDPVYSQSLQSFLDLFAKYNLKATFFIIGKDARNPQQIESIKAIAEQGHEIANHSMNHLPDFANLSSKVQRQEIIQAHDLLKAIIQKDPVGFRAPMFSINEQVISLLENFGYKYDASIIPSAIFPWLMNTAHSLLKLKPVNMRSGDIRFAKAPKVVYNPDKLDVCQKGNMHLKQVPVGISNLFGFPMHSTYAFTMGKFLFDSGFDFCLKNNTTLHYLFHGIDLLDLNQFSIKLPGFKSLSRRQDICEYIVKKIANNSQPITTEDLIAI